MSKKPQNQSSRKPRGAITNEHLHEHIKGIERWMEEATDVLRCILRHLKCHHPSLHPQVDSEPPQRKPLMFSAEIIVPNRARLTLTPDQALQKAPDVTVDNDASVVADPSNPDDGKGPFVFHISVGESFTPTNVSIVGDADPDPNIEEPITDTGVITWKHPHATTLGTQVSSEPAA